MEQPEIYNNLQELIDWLEYDLEEQRKEIAKEREILPDEVDKKDLTLNIGNKNKSLSIDFDFNFFDFQFYHYTNMNFKNVTFNKKIVLCNQKSCNINYDFSNTIFNEEVSIIEVKFDSKEDGITLNFSNAIFYKKLLVSNCKFINTNIYFSNAKFKREVRINSSKFIPNDKNLINTINNTSFDKAIFYNNLQLFNCKFKNIDIDFSNTIFKRNIKFYNSKFISNDSLINSKINFDEAIFRNRNNIKFESNKFYNIYINFNKCVNFHPELKFKRNLFNNTTLEFYKIKFYSNTIFYKNKFVSKKSTRIDFNYLKFYKKFHFIKCKLIGAYKINFSKNKFRDKVSFRNSKFISKNINKLNYRLKFYDSKFFDKLYFKQVYFNLYTYFSKITFYNNVSISLSIIANNTIFKNIEVKKHIKFNSIDFENQKAALSIKNSIKINEISFINVIINGRINIQNVGVETVDFKGSVINGGLVNPVNFKVNNFANRESALFLKNEAYARNNIIDALEYKAKEIEKHKEDLSKEIKKKFNIKKFGDIFSICLSSLYSDNGLNWSKSFLCTILFPTFFFTLSYNLNYITMFIYIFLSFTYFLFCNHNNKNNYNNKNIEEYIFISTIICLVVGFCQYIYFRDTKYIKELFNFIAPTDFSQISHENADTSYIYNCKSGIEIIFKGILYFLGKIAFWYGSVQTVQSFRKFSKKE